MSRRFPQLMRRKGARWTAGAASSPSVSYLLTYSANPLVFGPSTGENVAIAGVPGDDDEFRTEGFSVDVVLDSLGTLRYIYYIQGNARLWLSTANAIKIRTSAASTYTLTPASSIVGGDTLRIAVDFTGTTLHYKNVTQDTATETLAIGGDWDTAETTLSVGWDGSGSPWDGDIYQPVSFAAP